jgi:hypothetical protein
MTRTWMMAIALAALAACGPQAKREPASEAPLAGAPAETNSEAEAPAEVRFPPVDAALTQAPESVFTAIEPSELGVFGAPTIQEALAGLLAGGEDAQDQIHLSVRESGDSAVADIVRTGLADDSISAAHLRLELRREAAEGWYPVNAYRRQQCARGASAGQWSALPCP